MSFAFTNVTQLGGPWTMTELAECLLRTLQIRETSQRTLLRYESRLFISWRYPSTLLINILHSLTVLAFTRFHLCSSFSPRTSKNYTNVLIVCSYLLQSISEPKI